MKTLEKSRAGLLAPPWPNHSPSRSERRERGRVTQKIEKKVIQAPIQFDPLASADTLPSVVSPLAVAGESHRDCIAQVMGALMMRPSMRCIIGTVIARVTAPCGTEMWQPVWLFHCWLMTADGVFLDPIRLHVDKALANNGLKLNGDGSSAISLGVAGPGQATSQTPSVTASLVYAPGQIYYDPGESHAAKVELLAFGPAAKHCWEAGGWSFLELQEGLERLELEEQRVHQLQGVERTDAHAIANGWKE